MGEQAVLEHQLAMHDGRQFSHGLRVDAHPSVANDHLIAMNEKVDDGGRRATRTARRESFEMPCALVTLDDGRFHPIDHHGRGQHRPTPDALHDVELEHQIVDLQHSFAGIRREHPRVLDAHHRAENAPATYQPFELHTSAKRALERPNDLRLETIHSFDHDPASRHEDSEHHQQQRHGDKERMNQSVGQRIQYVMRELPAYTQASAVRSLSPVS